MNNVQRNVYDYLTSGEGSVDERETALNNLTERNFFRPTTQHASEEDLRDYIFEVREDGGFCTQGVDRFEQAILGATTAPTEPQPENFRLNIDLDLHVTYTPSEGAVGIANLADRVRRVVELLEAPEHYELGAVVLEGYEVH